MRLRQIPWSLIALVLFWLSLALPAVTLQSTSSVLGSQSDRSVPGVMCFALGWCTVPWYANIAVMTAALARAYESHRFAAVVSILAFADALTVLGYRELTPDLGFFAWIAAMAVLAIASMESLHARAAAGVRT